MIYLLTKVTSVKYLKEYQLELTFEDGIQKIVDLEKEIILLKDPLTEPLKDIEASRRLFRIFSRNFLLEFCNQWIQPFLWFYPFFYVFCQKV